MNLNGNDLNFTRQMGNVLNLQGTANIM